MFTLTITGNTPEELSENLKAMFSTRLYAIAADPNAAPTPQQPPVNPTPTGVPTVNPFATPPENSQPPIAPPTAPAVPAVANAPAAPAQVPTTPPPATPAANQMPPTSAPTYTIDALARAGATLAQSGKMQEALALLARYGVQTVNQLKPEQYGAFATELRALGAQV